MWKLARKLGRGVGVEILPYSRFQRALDALTASSGPPFFIQIGANNGIDFDDTYKAVTNHRMPGIVVEPGSRYFNSLQLAYERYPEVRPIRAAIHPTAKTMPMYFVRPERVTRPWEHGLASFDRNHIIRSDVPEDAIGEEKVECLSFNDLIDQMPRGRTIDVLSIDTEGFDAEILKMVDLDTIQPKVVRFESKHMTRDDLLNWVAEFRARGYRVDVDSEDAVCIHNSVVLNPVRRLLS